MVNTLLRPEDQQLVNDERRVLGGLRDVLIRLDAAEDNLEALGRSIQQLDELFLVVVVGEFNAGKSAFINALLGAQVLQEGVTPTTAQVNLLQYGESSSRVERSPQLHVITAPVEFLREIAIVDTPGTNAVIREHEAITADFVPRSDLVLFVTSADRPFTESERLFLAVIRDWGKKIVVVINKVDLLQSEDDRQQVLSFVSEHARAALGSAPDTFAVSARLAMRAKSGQPDVWAASGFEALERYIHERLDQRERLRLKLGNPIGIGSALTSRYLEVTTGRLGLLQDDLRLLDDVEKQHAVYRADMDRQFELRMGEIDHVLLQMEQRGHLFFDEMLRIGRVMDLLNKSRVQEGFTRDVVADAPVQIERKVSELIDWMVSADLRQWQQVNGHLAERRRQYRDRIVGDPELATFHVERGRLLESVGREAQRVVDSFDRQREAAALAEGARNAVAASAAVGAGAVGLGTLVTIAATTAAADITGIVLAGVIATVGLFIVPARRRKAKEDLRQKVADLRDTLSRSLRTQFQQETGRSTDRLNEGIAPYSRFVRSEQQALTAERDTLAEVQAEMAALKTRIDALV